MILKVVDNLELLKILWVIAMQGKITFQNAPMIKVVHMMQLLPKFSFQIVMLAMPNKGVARNMVCIIVLITLCKQIV